MNRISGQVATSIQVEQFYDNKFNALPCKVWWQSIDAGRAEKPVTHEVMIGTIEETQDEDFNFTYTAKSHKGKEKSGLTYQDAIAFLISPKE